MFCPSSGSVRVPSSAVGNPNIAGSGSGWAANAAVIGPRWLTTSDEPRHAGTEPAALVRVVDGAGGRQRALAIGQDRRERRLVRDERPDLLRVLRDEGERVHRTAAAGEEVDGPAVELGDDPMQVVGVLVGRRRAGRIGLRAALDARGGRR